ncbi:MAG: DsrE family protein [Gammaproteobacteria bacterium]|jgi:intracellular sulfur oxidation DsrE/DsrF family protein|nr:DsrE family protein [Gammaproteobacteria bacterium]MBU1409524.1 DsrE family protein [Gammaproteobacteria bacterium]MBU1530706.1 DsrE family protein [Gammaproteobacteria bacterium]
MKLLNTALGVLMAGLVAMPVFAHDDGHKKKGNNECPVGLVSGMSMDDEFGPGSQALTNCIKKRHDVKMVVQINQFCTNTANCAGSPYGLNNIRNILDDYEITHGMKPGKDYEMVVVLHSPGGRMALKDVGLNADGVEVSGRNPFEGTIKGLMARGVKFYFCQNTTRAFLNQPGASITSLPKYLLTGKSATDQMIEGMEYTTAGLTSIADFQARGYQYIQP